MLWRNRFALAIASLVWLIWRSGTQPRRLAYPCQQAAAANLGFLAVLFIPEAARRHAARRGPGRRAFALATGSVALAGVLTLLISAGVAVYSQYALTEMAVSIPPPATTPEPATVAIHQSGLSTLTAADVEALVRQAVADAGGLAGIVQPGDTVAIKPNLVNDNEWTEAAPTGVTTDPRVVAAVVKIVKEAGASAVTIVEGTAGPAEWDTTDEDELGREITWLAYQKCGYDADGDRLFDYDDTVALIDLNDAGYINGDGEPDLVPRPVETAPPNTVKVMLENGVIRTSYFVPKAILRPDQGGTCDVLISVPTLKNHSNGAVTLAMKNRVGCAPSDIYHNTEWADGHENQMKWDLVHWAVPYRLYKLPPEVPFKRDVLHSNPPAPIGMIDDLIENTTVNYTIVDLNLVRPNDFAVVDGLVGITDGPTGTTKANPTMNLIMAGKDSVAVDTVGTLLMGYNPLESLQIGWAWNRGLGARDTSMITVVGEHVDELQQQWPMRGGSAPGDSNPPSLTNVLPPEGATVFGDVSITGTVSDDIGLSKAEVLVKLTSAPNLVVNGDFEAGSTGWNTWRAPWGLGETWDFDNTEPGHLGDNCLRVCSAKSRLGLYLYIPVTPGKKYRVDAYWKGQKLGTNGADNWYEVLLLDGPWNYGQADGNANDWPYDDPSEPVFNEMYGYDSHTFAMLGDFGWEWTHDLNDTLVDTMTRDGVRQASGSVMTVVLKAGAAETAATASGWFDDISLVEVVEDKYVQPNPSGSFEIIWPAIPYPNGEYELTVTVYDIALNEKSEIRHVTKTDIPSPLISTSTTLIDVTDVVSSDPPAQEFTVWNSGIGTLDYDVLVVDNPSWVTVSPSEGMSDGEEDPFTVTFNTDDLTAGTHVATIMIRDGGASSPRPAYNDPQTIEVRLTLETVKSDFNGDGDVDQDDFGFIQACLTGPGEPILDAECEIADLQKDHDVDVVDVNLFRYCFGGANQLAPITCDDTYP